MFRSLIYLAIFSLTACESPTSNDPVMRDVVDFEVDLDARDGRGTFAYIDGTLLEEVDPGVDQLSDINIQLTLTEAVDGVQLVLLPQTGESFCLLDNVPPLTEIEDEGCTTVDAIQLWSNGADDAPLDVLEVAFQIPGVTPPLSAVFRYDTPITNGPYAVRTLGHLELLDAAPPR